MIYMEKPKLLYICTYHIPTSINHKRIRFVYNNFLNHNINSENLDFTFIEFTIYVS